MQIPIEVVQKDAGRSAGRTAGAGLNGAHWATVPRGRRVWRLPLALHSPLAFKIHFQLLLNKTKKGVLLFGGKFASESLGKWIIRCASMRRTF